MGQERRKSGASGHLPGTVTPARVSSSESIPLQGQILLLTERPGCFMSSVTSRGRAPSICLVCIDAGREVYLHIWLLREVRGDSKQMLVLDFTDSLVHFLQGVGSQIKCLHEV